MKHTMIKWTVSTRNAYIKPELRLPVWLEKPGKPGICEKYNPHIRCTNADPDTISPCLVVPVEKLGCWNLHLKPTKLKRNWDEVMRPVFQRSYLCWHFLNYAIEAICKKSNFATHFTISNIKNTLHMVFIVPFICPNVWKHEIFHHMDPLI